jgi:outer membrane immunogenic protein
MENDRNPFNNKIYRLSGSYAWRMSLFCYKQVGTSSNACGAGFVDTVQPQSTGVHGMKLLSRTAALLALTSIAGAAYAQDVIVTQTNPWAGFYVGANLGAAINTTCNTWQQNILNDQTGAFNNRDCPNNSVFVGGVQIGYNFQFNQWVWGFGMDYDYWSAKARNRTVTYGGGVEGGLPPGTYSFSGKASPNGFGILGPRVGYAFDNLLPYVRIGGVYAGGSRNGTAYYNDGDGGTASFSGGKNFKSSGFGAGAGLEYLLGDTWSARVEYTYVKLGKGDNTVTQCTGSAAVCGEFADISLDNIHNSFTASVIRLGINYKFN